jgi:Fic-DOC domain mobile mystery protein B
VSDVLFDEDDSAATPISPEDRAQLRLTFVTTPAELNAVEQEAISDADRWAFSRRRKTLDAKFLTGLHRRMFKSVWRWAGSYRTTEVNIGVAPYRIETDLHQMLDDVRYWVANQTHEPDDIAVRFHHRLVSIHPFPNGNGRHARLAADLLIVELGGARFSWGSVSLAQANQARRRYVAALRAADRHDVRALLLFARS